MTIKPGLFRTFVQRLSYTVLVVVSFSLGAVPTDAADVNQQGWEAHDRGDFARAFQLWLPLAQQGQVTAQINIGVMYDYGKGVPQNYASAAEWYRAAALQNHVIAQYNYGVFLGEGKVAAVGDEDAQHWLLKAATQGYADAQYKLGIMYAQNAVGQEQKAAASEWLYKAGITYLSSGDSSGAASATSALKAIDSDHHLALELDARAAKNIRPSLEDIGESHSTSVSTGTAWSVATGYAVTNHHVVAGKSSIYLTNHKGEKVLATVVASDVEHDIALLSVAHGKLPPALFLAASNARLGASVFTIGFPRVDVMGKTPKLSLGIISSINGLSDDPTSYQISVPIQPGNSGGPLINMRGEVVGLITTMLGTVGTNNGEPQPLASINYALKADYVEALLRNLPDRSTMVEKSVAHDSDNLEALADRIQHSVMIVMAE